MKYTEIVPRRTYDSVSRERFSWAMPDVPVFDGVESSFKTAVVSIATSGIEVRPAAMFYMGLMSKSNNGPKRGLDGQQWIMTRIPGYPLVFLQALPPGLIHGVRRGTMIDRGSGTLHIKFIPAYYSRLGLIRGHYEFHPAFSISNSKAIAGYPSGIFGFSCVIDNKGLDVLSRIWHRKRYLRVRHKIMYVDLITATRIFALGCKNMGYSIDPVDNSIWISPSSPDDVTTSPRLHYDIRAGYVYAEVPVRAHKAGLTDGYYEITDFATFDNWGYNRVSGINPDDEGIPEVLRNVF